LEAGAKLEAQNKVCICHYRYAFAKTSHTRLQNAFNSLSREVLSYQELFAKLNQLFLSKNIPQS
jgi:hypothetical protein